MTVPFKVLLEDTGEEITFILSHDDAEKSAKAAMMEHGPSKSAKKQSQLELTIKNEVEAATSTVHIVNEIDLKHVKNEPGLVQSVKSEPALLVEEEILEDGGQDGNEQQCVQGTSTPVGTGSVNEACSTSLADLLNVKHELEDMDIEPTVFQHMDIHYTICKNTDDVTGESAIMDDCNKTIPCNEGKKESIADKLRDNKTISCKYCAQMMTKEIYDEAYLKSCVGQQKDLTLKQHLLRQQRATSSSGFKCKACERTFHKLQLLNTHKRLHQRNKNKTSVATSIVVAGPSNLSREDTVKVGQEPFACELCEKRYSSKAHLNVHKRLRSGIWLSVCHICDAEFSVKSNLANHLQIHTGEKPFQCDKCNAKFAKSDLLTRHMKRDHMGEKPFQCNTCNVKFARCSALTIHMRIHTGEKPYQCDICHARFSVNGNLTRHMRVHTGKKPYQCDTCDARFALNVALIRHIRTHTGEKPYQCDTCDASFAQSVALTRHLRVHNGEKPYQCDTCDARYAQSGDLAIHKRVHTGEKPYQCNTCNVKFVKSSSLTIHMRVHTGDKPYLCGTCNARFSISANLTRHMRVHTGEKPYQCDTCDARFALNVALTRHMRVHTGEKPYQCDTCDARFAQSVALTRHKRVHTGKPYQSK